MRITNAVQLSNFLKARDELNRRVWDLCAEYGYSSGAHSWEVDGDQLVVEFRSGGTYHPMCRYTQRFPLAELFARPTKTRKHK